jgi:hypothetical protein
MIKFRIYPILLFVSLSYYYSCSEPYFPKTLEEDQQFVIEGFVEAGENPFPVYVIVTKSIPYIAEISPETFNSIFIDSAEVIVNDGDKDILLTRLCANDTDLPPVIAQAVAEFFGIEISETAPNICVYVDIFDQVVKEVGRTYDLKVNIGETQITGTTTIPRHIPLNQIRFDEPPGEPSDSLARLWASADDPVGTDYYRYQTAINDSIFVAPFNSVTDDAFFDGRSFEFPLDRAAYPTEQIDFNNFGLWARGDSAHIKWMNLDKAHFDFWNTRDNSANSGGPFSNYIRIKGNLHGALGIWGGYSVSYYSTYVPPK